MLILKADLSRDGLDIKDIDGGFVAFTGSPKGGKVTGKDPLGKFDGKDDEGFLVGYFINSKAFRVFNTRTRKVEENLHINFLKNKPNVVGSGPKWLFDNDSLTKSINYEPVTAGNQTNSDAGIETNVNVGQARQEKASDHEYILLPLMLSNSPLSSSSHNKDVVEVPGKGDDDLSEKNGQEKEEGASNTEDDQHVQDFRAELDNLLVQHKEGYANNTNRVSTVNPSVSVAGQGFDNTYDQERIDNITQDVNTVGPSINTSSENINTGSLNINIASPIPNDPSMQSLEATCIFDDAYDDREEVGAEVDLNNLVTTMNVWTLVDLPKGKRAIETKWVYRNKKDKRGIVVRNKARLVDVKSAFLYGTIKEEVYVCQPPGFEDPQFPDKVYRVMQRSDGTFISQDKYVADILKKFDFSSVKTTSTPIETNKALLKDEEAEDVDVHLYRSMIGSVMYLTASRPDRIFRYLKGQPKLSLWYPRDSPFDLEAFSDSDYARVSLDRKSITGCCQFLRKRLISWQCKKQTIVANSTTEAEKAKRTTEISQSSGPIHLVADETIYKEWEDRMERAATTTSSLEAEQDSGAKIPYWGGSEAHIRFDTASIQSNDPPLSRVNTLGSREDNIKLKELMEFCTKLSERALDL
ncbi:putative ribonuclease H-like domain-containing protein [Tanacetum coccineum]|uniref:Ribonuclease H-like domain-containing protein n=1 Tax=Tanacetum coccineum TaxID=301880 RepID=A0ABQ4YS26_9ASTR